jgi:hypothetical protein
MTNYTPQTEDLKHTLDDIAGLPGLIDAGVFPSCRATSSIRC